MGHTYNYRVKTENFLGFGSPSSSFPFTPRQVPATPSSAPSNVPASTTRTVIYITYPAIINTGGAPILNYNIYIDDGNGAYGAAINNGLLLTYNTALLTLTTGLTYRIKYSSTNIAGESALSPAVPILLAEVPSVPTLFVRINSDILPAGTIEV